MINTTERGFEHPFCQLLIGEGHEIIHIDSHSAREDGKDVLSVDPQGRLCGFQLKAGNIDVGRWRSEVEPELRELAELSVHHPRFDGQYCHGALVTTGTLNEAALHKFSAFNQSIRDRGVGKPIELIDHNALVDRFLRCEHAVLPVEPSEFRAFLQLVLADGTDCLDHLLFSQVLDNLLPADRSIRSGEAKRLISGSLVLAAHALSNATAAENHLAVCEGWTLAAARIARVALEHELSPSVWRPSFDLAVSTAHASLKALEAEAIANEDLVSGSLLGDGGEVWQARATMVAGAIAVNRLLGRVQGQDTGDEGPAIAFIDRFRPYFRIWGESAVPYFLAMYWYLRSIAHRTIREENYLAVVLRSLAKVNSQRGQRSGIPAPYFRPEACLRRILLPPTDDEEEQEAFGGSAYTVLPITALLVRAMRRQTLNLLWPEITDISHTWIEGLSPAEFLRYRTQTGRLRNRFLPRPTSWAALRSEFEEIAQTADARLPSIFVTSPAFALLFLLVHPHRITLDFALWLDRTLERA